jgi:hypothetical protein
LALLVGEDSLTSDLDREHASMADDASGGHSTGALVAAFVVGLILGVIVLIIIELMLGHRLVESVPFF